MADVIRRLLLRSPLHRLGGKRLLLHLPDGDVVLPHHRDGDDLTVLAGAAEDWWRGLAAEDGVDVEVTLGGQRRRGRLRFLSGDDLDAALIPYLSSHPGAWTKLGVPPNASEGDVADAAQGAGVGRITLA